MQRSPLWTLMQRVQHALKSGNSEAQDIAISNLQEFLDNTCAEYFPTFVYPPLGRVLRYYCAKTLDQLALSAEDRQYVRQVFTATIDRLDVQQQAASQIEGQMRAFMARLRAREFAGVADLLASLARIVGIGIPEIPRELEQAYRLLGKSPFTTTSLTPFLETLLKTVVSGAEAVQFAPLRYIFWDQAAEQTQMKAALVNPFSQEARITRLDVWTVLEPQGSDHLTFDNEVDDRLYASCCQALEAARRFVEPRFPGLLERKGIRVTCRFPDPIASYSDASVSALVGLKVVGDLLELPVNPAAIISADVERSGKIRPVNHLVAKVMAADAHPGAAVFYLPLESAPVRVAHIALRRIATFSEAVEQYYGAAYQQKLAQISRRKLLKGALGLAMAPFTFSIAKHLFLRSDNPVTDCDWQLLECARDLYQQKSDYRSAITILNSILTRFYEEKDSPETLQISAFAFGELGVIHLQQHQESESISAFHHALKLWQTLHDRAKQADVLLRLGEVYRYRVAIDGFREYSKEGLECYEQANSLLHPTMKMYSRLRGRYFALSGYMYYWLSEYELAEKYNRQGIEVIEPNEQNWTYQTVKQHLGRVLIKREKYDEAFEILETTAQASVLQSPYYQVRSYWTLGDFYFSTGDYNQGITYISKASDLCQKYDLRGQYRLLTKIATKHQMLPEILSIS